jgi:two-component sensor histidine kinase
VVNSAARPGILEFLLSAAQADSPNLSPASSPPEAGAEAAGSPARPAWVGWLVPALVAAFALFLISAGLLIYAVGQLNQSQLLVARVLEARGQALNIRLVARQAESLQRGYLLTGDKSILAEYQGRRGAFPAELAKLDQQVTLPEQQQRLDRIGQLGKEKFDEMDQTIALADNGQRDAAFDLVRTGRGEELMTQISGLFDAFLATASERLQLRQQQAQENLFRMWAVAVVAGIATIALAILVAAFTRMQFVSLRRSEAALQNLNRELEARVVERTFELEAARDRAETLLRDVNHRVGNNLALVSSFLGLQMRAVSDEASRRALSSARNRVHTIATTQRKLRLGTGSDTARIDSLLKEVVDDLVASMPGADRVTVHLDAEPLAVPSDEAVSVSVIVSELVMNAMKYAFPGGSEGRVAVQLSRHESGALLTVEDDGTGKAEPVDTGSVGLGSQIIYLLSKHFGGEPKYQPGSGAGERPGLVVIVPLPLLKIEPPQS